jgi:hypothetical protein
MNLPEFLVRKRSAQGVPIRVACPTCGTEFSTEAFENDPAYAHERVLNEAYQAHSEVHFATKDAPSTAYSPPQHAPIPFEIGEEYGTASKSLPAIKYVLIAIVLVALAAAVLIAFQEQAPATGVITHIESVEVPGQEMVMVAINISMHNRSNKPFQIRSIQAQIDVGKDPLKDNATSSVDLDRYFQAFPALKQHALAPLARENTIAANADEEGTIVVTFPVTPGVFAGRKSMKVTIQSYDRGVPVVMTK